MIESARLRATVGGVSFLARGPLLLLVPTSLLTSLLSRDITDLSGLAGWSLANLLAFLFCWGWIVIGDRALFPLRAERPVAVSLVVMFGASLGALKGAATDLAGVVLGLGELAGSAVAWRSAGTAVLGAVAVPAVAALAVAVERYRTEHALLVAETLGRMRNMTGDGPRSTGGSVGLSAFIVDARRMLDRVDPSEAAATIVRLVDERLRPLTHELWTSGDAPPSELDGGALLRIAVLRNPLPLAGIVVPYTLSVLPLSVQAVGPLMGTVRAAFAGLGLLIVLGLARALRPEHRGPVAAVVHLVLTLLAATAVQIAQWDRFLGGMPEPSDAALWVTVGIWLTGLVLVGGAAAGALRDRARVRDELLRAIGPDVMRAVALEDHDRLEARRVATRLHGDLQGQMIATARRIEQYAGDGGAVERELALLDGLLAGFAVERTGSEQGTLVDRLDSLAGRWRGFLDLIVELDEGAEVLVGEDADRVEGIVEEAVVNAMRHGLATLARVGVTTEPALITVTVTDDGIGPRDGRPGLGAMFFGLASQGAWALTPGPEGGAVLVVRSASRGVSA